MESNCIKNTMEFIGTREIQFEEQMQFHELENNGIEWNSLEQNEIQSQGWLEFSYIETDYF